MELLHPFLPADYDVMHTVQNYWGNFATTANPNLGKNVEVKWPSFDEVRDENLRFGRTAEVMDGLQSSQCDFHDKMLGYD